MPMIAFHMLATALAASELAASCVHVAAVGQRPPFLSGIIATYIEVIATNRSGAVDVYLLPYMNEDQAVPASGQKCRITFRIARVHGWVGSEARNVPQAKVIVKFSC